MLGNERQRKRKAMFGSGKDQRGNAEAEKSHARK